MTEIKDFVKGFPSFSDEDVVRFNSMEPDMPSPLMVMVDDVKKKCLDKTKVKNDLTRIWEQSSSFEDFKRYVFYWIEDGFER